MTGEKWVSAGDSAFIKHTQSVILVDLDSTVADTRHRSHLTPHNDPTATWDSYSMHCDGDAPIQGTVALLRLLVARHRIAIVSGRSFEAVDLTMDWLSQHRVPWDVMRLRYQDDCEDPLEYKRSVLQELENQDIVLALEDWPAVAQMWEDNGIPTVCVNPRYHEDPNAYFVR